MTLSYPEIFIPDAQNTLGQMYAYAVHIRKYNIDEFQDLFIESGDADSFAAGNIELIAGMSGMELAHHVLWSLQILTEELEIGCKISKNSNEYRAGAIVAYFQRHTGRSFQNIHSYFPMSQFVEFAKIYQNMSDDEIFEKITYEICKIVYQNDPEFLKLLEDEVNGREQI